jgi:cytoskeletal protein CcmA (bactofilin family)
MKKGKNIIAFLGKDTEFNGTITFDGDIRMDGRFKGEIKGGDSLVIGEEGVVEAEINVPYVIIMGEVKGDIFAERKVVIHSKGKAYGVIKSPSLVIEDGGIFNGRSLMQDIEQMDEEKVIMLSSQKMIGMVD